MVTVELVYFLHRVDHVLLRIVPTEMDDQLLQRNLDGNASQLGVQITEQSYGFETHRNPFDITRDLHAHVFIEVTNS